MLSPYFTNPDKELTDASNFTIGCILSQISDSNKFLHPVAFYSISLLSSECNYSIYDKGTFDCCYSV